MAIVGITLCSVPYFRKLRQVVQFELPVSFISHLKFIIYKSLREFLYSYLKRTLVEYLQELAMAL